MGIKVKVGDVEIGTLTEIRVAPATTGSVYEIKSISPSDVTQSRGTIPISDGAYCDPFEPHLLPKKNPKPNRAQRRKQKP